MDADDVKPPSGGARKFLKIAVFITTPMIVAAPLLLIAGVRPAALRPATPKPTSAESARVQWLEQTLANAQRDADLNGRKVRALEERLRQSGSPPEASIDAIPMQRAVAVAAAVVGVLSIAGPSTFVRFFLAFIGSTTGGLFVGALATFRIKGTLLWLDSFASLLNGSAGAVPYVLWALLFALGMLRWWTGWECAIYEYADVVVVGESGNISVPRRRTGPRKIRQC